MNFIILYCAGCSVQVIECLLSCHGDRRAPVCLCAPGAPTCQMKHCLYPIYYRENTRLCYGMEFDVNVTHIKKQ